MYLTNGTLLQGGKYRIERYISSGGFGNTYEGLDVSLDKRVAIKEFFVKDFCSRDSETTLVTVTAPSKAPLIEHLKRKFIEEARAIAGMEHENIVKVQSLFEENGTAYYVMDYVDGESVGDLLKRRGSLPESEALSIIRKVASALDYMHKQNRFHLDVKPANIMLRRDGKVILIDFGSSKQYAEVDGENTTTFAPCYTPGYAPSEQMNPAHTTFTAATDIYALGATLYKILTGVTPPSAISLMNGEETLAPLPNEVSPQVKACVQKAMIPQRNMRLQSIAQWEALLKADEQTLTANDIGQSFTEETLVIKDAAENMVEKGLALYNEGYYDSALEHWHKAAEQGSTEALYHIGVCHAKGKGVPEDTEKAVEWYRKAAERGYIVAQNVLGECYAEGQGGEESKTEAARWYRKAAEQGYAEAQFNLAKCYAKGEGVQRDSAEALRWYCKAAEQDHAESQYTIGKWYAYGIAVKKDEKEALRWYRKAAEQGHAESQYAIGECYANGYGVEQNEKEALKWYRKAAEQGCGEAMFNLGQHYEDDDYIEAVKWYQKAEENGCKKRAQEAKRTLLKAEARKFQPWYIPGLYKMLDSWLGLFCLFFYGIVCPIGGLASLYVHWGESNYQKNMEGVACMTIIILLIILYIYKVIAYNRRAEEYKSKHPDDPVNEYL